MSGPARIVSLSPSNTEILCALGLRRRLVGVDKWSDHPPSVARLPRVGRGTDIDVAAVAALRPDLVVASLSVPGMERNLPRLEEAGLPFVTLEPNGLDTVYANIRLAARATDRAARGERLAADMERRLALARERAARAGSRPRVYWEWWPKPLVAAAGSGWMTELIAMAGGANVFADAGTDTVRPTPEEVGEREPEVIVACWCGARTPPRTSRLGGRAGWETVPAVRTGRVHVVPEALFGRPGPRLADGLELLVSLLHPELDVRS